MCSGLWRKPGSAFILMCGMSKQNQKPRAAHLTQRCGTKGPVFLPMPSGRRAGLRASLIASAKRICQNPLPNGMPCGDCIYTAGTLHCDSVALVVNFMQQGPVQSLCAEIMSAAMDA